MPTVVVTFTISGVLSSFDTPAQANFTANLASLWPHVSASDISLLVSAASIKVEATVLTTTSGAQEIASTLSALSPTNLTGVLGVPILSASTPIVGIKAVGAPPPPPWPDCFFGGRMYYYPVSPSRCEMLGRWYEEAQARATATLVGGISGGVVGCICLVAACWYCRRRRKQRRARVVSRTVGPNLPAPASQMAVSVDSQGSMPPPPPSAVQAVAVGISLTGQPADEGNEEVYLAISMAANASASADGVTNTKAAVEATQPTMLGQISLRLSSSFQSLASTISSHESPTAGMPRAALGQVQISIDEEEPTSNITRLPVTKKAHFSPSENVAGALEADGKRVAFQQKMPSCTVLMDVPMPRGSGEHTVVIKLVKEGGDYRGYGYLGMCSADGSMNGAPGYNHPGVGLNTGGGCYRDGARLRNVVKPVAKTPDWQKEDNDVPHEDVCSDGDTLKIVYDSTKGALWWLRLVGDPTSDDGWRTLAGHTFERDALPDNWHFCVGKSGASVACLEIMEYKVCTGPSAMHRQYSAIPSAADSAALKDAKLETNDIKLSQMLSSCWYPSNKITVRHAIANGRFNGLDAAKAYQLPKGGDEPVRPHLKLGLTRPLAAAFFAEIGVIRLDSPAARTLDLSGKVEIGGGDSKKTFQGWTYLQQHIPKSCYEDAATVRARYKDFDYGWKNDNSWIAAEYPDQLCVHFMSCTFLHLPSNLPL